MYEMPAVFTDQRGEEHIVFESDGTSLHTTIRGISVAGEFDFLEPEGSVGSFDLCSHGSISNYDLIVDIPIKLITPQELRTVQIKAEMNFRGPTPIQDFTLSLVQPEFSIRSVGRSLWFEDELFSLLSQLPDGFRVECCLTCGLSDYSPFGSGTFGCLACFRDAASDYRQVNSKAGIFKIWDSMTEFVQETHYCPKYEMRRKGAGYRG